MLPGGGTRCDTTSVSFLDILHPALEEKPTWGSCEHRQRLGKDRAESNNRTSFSPSLAPSLPELFSPHLSSLSRGASSHVAAAVSLFRYQGRIVRIDCDRRTAQLLAFSPPPPPPPPRVVRDAHLTSQKEKTHTTPRTVDNGFYNLTLLPRLVAAGRRDISSRRTDRTDGTGTATLTAVQHWPTTLFQSRNGWEELPGGFRGFFSVSVDRCMCVCVCVAARSRRSQRRSS